MLARIGQRIAAVFRATAPDPFVIAILLTFLTMALVLIFTDASPGGAVAAWADPGSGVWRFLKFSMQMCLILVTGHALASSPPASWMLTKLSRLPRSSAQAIALVGASAAMLGVLNWGLGLIGGAILARRVGVAMEKRGVLVHYPLLAAAGYMGLLVWHGGFSGTAPLKVSKLSEITDIFGADAPIGAIPTTETILSPMNLIITGGLIIIAPLALALMCPKATDDSIEQASKFVPAEPVATANEANQHKPFLPRVLEDTPIVSFALAGMIGVWAWGYYFPADLAETGVKSLTPDTVNLTMLMLGLILHGTPRRYAEAVADAASGCSGIILQFPLYAGIMGMMETSGLTKQIADSFINLAGSSEAGLSVMTFLSAGLVNLFVPSGGGQWAIQGPIVMQAADSANVAPSRIVMALAYGDQWTNMLQPFWALPLLAVTGVKARDIVGYTAIVLVVAGIWIGACLTLL